MEANFMGMKYDLKWQDPDRCSRVVVINCITNLAIQRSIMFDEEFTLQVLKPWDNKMFVIGNDKDLLDT